MSDPKAEIVKTVFALAYADGNLDKGEERFIDFLLDSYGLTPEDVNQAQAAELSIEDLKKTASELTDPGDRAKAYEFASLVCLMDGSRQPEESEMLRNLKEAFEIDAEKALEIEGRARQVYNRFAKKISE